MSQSSAETAFQQAYVACGYLLGVRGEELTRGLRSPEASAAVDMKQRLTHTDQAQRAAALASELTRVAQSLAECRLW